MIAPGPRTALRGVIVFTLLASGLLVLWELSGLDRTIMTHLADVAGFPLRHQWALERLLHDAMRYAAALAYLIVVMMVWRPTPAMALYGRWARFEIVVGITLSLLVVAGLKQFSLTSCPWDLQAFGGAARYVPHWLPGVKDGGAGHCFPSGHASGAFAFFALAIPGLISSRAADRHRGRRTVLVILLLGTMLGVTQTLRGAHYPSHAMWTALFCWVVAWLNHALFAVLRPAMPAAFKRLRRTRRSMSAGCPPLPVR